MSFLRWESNRCRKRWGGSFHTRRPKSFASLGFQGSFQAHPGILAAFPVESTLKDSVSVQQFSSQIGNIKHSKNQGLSFLSRFPPIFYPSSCTATPGICPLSTRLISPNGIQSTYPFSTSYCSSQAIPCMRYTYFRQVYTIICASRISCPFHPRRSPGVAIFFVFRDLPRLMTHYHAKSRARIAWPSFKSW